MVPKIYFGKKETEYKRKGCGGRTKNRQTKKVKCFLIILGFNV